MPSAGFVSPKAALQLFHSTNDAYCIQLTARMENIDSQSEEGLFRILRGNASQPSPMDVLERDLAETLSIASASANEFPVASKWIYSEDDVNMRETRNANFEAQDEFYVRENGSGSNTESLGDAEQEDRSTVTSMHWADQFIVDPDEPRVEKGPLSAGADEVTPKPFTTPSGQDISSKELQGKIQGTLYVLGEVEDPSGIGGGAIYSEFLNHPGLDYLVSSERSSIFWPFTKGLENLHEQNIEKARQEGWLNEDYVVLWEAEEGKKEKDKKQNEAQAAEERFE
jgi:hypothetical protein